MPRARDSRTHRQNCGAESKRDAPRPNAQPVPPPLPPPDPWGRVLGKGAVSGLSVFATPSQAYRWMWTLYHRSLRWCAFVALLWNVVHYTAHRTGWVRFTASLYPYHVCPVYQQRPVHGQLRNCSVTLSWCVSCLTCVFCLMDGVNSF